jgi:transposase
LLPTIKPRDVVVMDNLNSHKSKFVRDLICKAGARLFILPAYSPDMNAIEVSFAKIKTIRGKADARNEDVINIAFEAIATDHAKAVVAVDQQAALLSKYSENHASSFPTTLHT